MGSFFSKMGFAVNIGTAFLLLLGYLAQFVPPDNFWPLSFFGLAFPYLSLLNVVFLVLWAFQKSKRMLLPIFVLLIGLNNINNTIQLIPKAKKKGNGVKVLSYNIHHFNEDKRAKRQKDPRVLEYLKSQSSDIVCLQETQSLKSGKFSLKGISDELPKINNYQLASSSIYSGLATFSKFPIVNMGEIRFSGSSNLVLFSDIKVNGHLTIRVYNCHLQSYSIDPDDYNVTDFSGSEEQQMEKAHKISYKLKVGFVQRASQARMVADHIGKSPYPVIVCGDFNDTPVSYTYRKVRGKLRDAFVESGWGISNTYNGKLPSFRIDYILSDKKFTISDYECDHVYFSDHFPIHCEINMGMP